MVSSASSPAIPDAASLGRYRQPLKSDEVTLFLCGDVMTGRGIDQVLPHPSDPRLEEPDVRSARDYVALAEAANGPIPKPVDFAYIWGEALQVLGGLRPDARVVNLETSVTRSDDLVPKGINYRMHPGNLPCLAAAGIDCCVLANKHVLDWGERGLLETLHRLRGAGIRTAGAGRNASEAEAPAIFDLGQDARLLVFAMNSTTSGIPRSWAATADRPGINLLPELSESSARWLGDAVRRLKRPGGVAIASIHWGGNWGYEIPSAQRDFAHHLIDQTGVDIVHGHSSHHVKGIEVYKEKLILYGCGDFRTDYEGIRGNEDYRDDLVLMHLPTVATATGGLHRLRMVPLQLRRFRLQRPSPTDVRWLCDTLTREGAAFGTRAVLQPDDTLLLAWPGARP
jgi:poly-gamma-glutamate capsule biosynthesis protein CapA/YwtB (metallophosphatase superfamily)